jgi:hypothetical protein
MPYTVYNKKSKEFDTVLRRSDFTMEAIATGVWKRLCPSEVQDGSDIVEIKVHGI